MSTLTVGAGKEFLTISAAVAASHDGDVIAVDAGTYTNDFATINTKITIEGVGGMVHLVATEAPPNGKAILVADTDVTIDHLEFSGAAVPDGNGAGIRYEAGNLTITNSYFHDNQDGLLAADNPSGSITIKNSEFSHNGTGDGFTHNLYVGDVGALTITGSYFHDAVVGHEIKSRAESTVISDTRIDDGPNGTASFSVDLPNGGQVILSNNVIERGPNSDNPVIVAFGEEGSLHPSSSLQLTGNTILNDLASPSAKLLLNPTNVTASVSDNSVYGLTSSQYAQGPATISNMTTLSSEPALDTSSPWNTSIPSITAANFSVAPNQSVAISPDLTLSNPSGDNLTVYRVLDHGGGSGHLTVGGTVEPDGQWFKASANWSNVQYVGGSSAGTNSLRVEVFDATTHSWVASSYFKATTTTHPTITATNFSVTANQSVAISPDLTLFNPSGDNFTIYRVLGHGGGSGHLTVGGTVEPDGQWFKASANWSNVQYVGGSSAGTDALKVEAYDATTKSWVLSNVFKATTASPSPPPSPVGVQDHQGLEPSASIIGIQDHQGLEHQTMV